MLKVRTFEALGIGWSLSTCAADIERRWLIATKFVTKVLRCHSACSIRQSLWQLLLKTLWKPSWHNRSTLRPVRLSKTGMVQGFSFQVMAAYLTTITTTTMIMIHIMIMIMWNCQRFQCHILKVATCLWFSEVIGINSICAYIYLHT